MYPTYKCYWGSGESDFTLCNNAEFCNTHPDVTDFNKYIDWSDKYSLLNWVNTFDMHCGFSFEIWLFGSLFFIGFIIACLLVPSLSDTYGRKSIIIASCWTQVIFYGAIAFVPNMMLYFVAVFIIGFTTPMRTMVAYTHLLEFMPTKVTVLSSLLFFLDGMVLVVSPLILNFFTN